MRFFVVSAIAPVLTCLISLLEFSGQAQSVTNRPTYFVTWQHDPTSTMIVRWLDKTDGGAEIHYRRPGTNEWLRREGESRPIPGSDLIVHSVELKNLTPASIYEFTPQVEGAARFRFRTMPRNLDRPVRFVEGGDVYSNRKWMETMNELAGRYDPAFVALGGDLAYSRGRQDVPEKYERWVEFFESWHEKSRTPDGRLIPILAAIGNHETSGFAGQPVENAPGYYTLFATPKSQGYQCLDFGNYMSVLLLDSGITHPIEGVQAKWLKTTLAARTKVPHKFPLYHIPAYSSIRPELGGENGELSQRIRDEWCPLFERYGVRISFEHHDHNYKRSYPIWQGKINPRGVLYLGDGAWAVTPRKPDLVNMRWYLEKSLSTRHFFVVTIFPESRQVLAVNDRGEIFDEVYQRVKK